MALVSLEAAKNHLRLSLAITTDDDDTILKMEQATAIVLKHLKSQAVAGWSDGTVPVPGNVEAAVLITLSYLKGYLTAADAWQAVERLLIGFRDPALA